MYRKQFICTFEWYSSFKIYFGVLLSVSYMPYMSIPRAQCVHSVCIIYICYACAIFARYRLCTASLLLFVMGGGSDGGGSRTSPSSSLVFSVGVVVVVVWLPTTHIGYNVHSTQIHSRDTGLWPRGGGVSGRQHRECEWCMYDTRQKDVVAKSLSILFYFIFLFASCARLVNTYVCWSVRCWCYVYMGFNMSKQKESISFRNRLSCTHNTICIGRMQSTPFSCYNTFGILYIYTSTIRLYIYR